MSRRSEIRRRFTKPVAEALPMFFHVLFKFYPTPQETFIGSQQLANIVQDCFGMGFAKADEVFTIQPVDPDGFCGLV